MKPQFDDGSTDCRPAAAILNLIGGKWTVLIITRLGEGPMRFSEIKRMIGGITQKVLTATLRDLEMHGLVHRNVTPTIPPRVDYELSALGRDLLVPVEALNLWARDNGGRVLAAKTQFVAQNPDASPSRVGRVTALVAKTRSSVVHR